MVRAKIKTQKKNQGGSKLTRIEGQDRLCHSVNLATLVSEMLDLAWISFAIQLAQCTGKSIFTKKFFKKADVLVKKEVRQSFVGFDFGGWIDGKCFSGEIFETFLIVLWC